MKVDDLNVVSNDKSSRIRELMDSARDGNVVAQNKVGVMCFVGKEIKRDYSLALYWFTRAAAKGHPHAQFNLAMMYLIGGRNLGRMKSMRAYAWIKKAALNGLAWAQYLMGVSEEFPISGLCEEFPSSSSHKYPPRLITDKALEWYEMAAENGHLLSMLMSAIAYDGGHGPSQSIEVKSGGNGWPNHMVFKQKSRDPKKAFALYARLYERGLKWGGIKARMAEMLEVGDGVEKDDTAACETYKKLMTTCPSALGNAWVSNEDPENVQRDIFSELQGIRDSFSQDVDGDWMTEDGYHFDLLFSTGMFEWQFYADDWFGNDFPTENGIIHEDMLIPTCVLSAVLPHCRCLPSICDVARKLIVMRRSGRGIPLSQRLEDECEELIENEEYCEAYSNITEPERNYVVWKKLRSGRCLQARGHYDVKFFKQPNGIVLARDANGRVYRWNAALRLFIRYDLRIEKKPWMLREGEKELSFSDAYKEMTKFDEKRLCFAYEDWQKALKNGEKYWEWEYWYHQRDRVDRIVL